MKYSGFYKDQLKFKATMADGSEKDFFATEAVKTYMKANWKIGDSFDTKGTEWEADKKTVKKAAKWVPGKKTDAKKAPSQYNKNTSTQPKAEGAGYGNKDKSIIRQVIAKIAAQIVSGNSGNLDEFDSAYMRLKSTYEDEFLGKVDLNASAKVEPKKSTTAPVSEAMETEDEPEIEEQTME